ncbi:substrate-binding domain-containing protein [Pseudonocardia sp. MH-G8]|uniref:substrate-binding domain-containing protein n=1 Tax=Pseudonocardia sp. MH-G8 TaxID=1854588 RepID=UPI000BA12ACC|nr:substrate-binding domain-containing protein [Pseudonocardia sp. MH-G8]OZM82574.1 LacI family transcriptional regulator [Pseudonocardia sp. MH-G8]
MSKPSARQERILAILRSRGQARVAALAQEFDVSPITMRRDVEALARDEQVVRGHGIVRLPSTRRTDRSRRPAADVVVLMAPLHNTYLGQILTGAREAAEQQGLRWELLGVEETEPTRSAMRRAAAVPDVLGALIIPRWRSITTVAAEEAEPVDDAAPSVHAVLLERFPPVGSVLAELDAVRTDHTRGVLLALRHLRERGHTRILLAARDDSPTGRTIRSAYLGLVPELGLPLIAEPLLSAPGAAPDPATPMPYLPDVVRRTGATALVAHSDVDALNLVTQLHAAGLRVPDDLSVVAYDDMVSGLGGLELTVVAPPKREVGREALTLLQDRVERGGPVRHVELLPALVDRGSTREIT